jgi:hypothetical protein
MNIKRSYIGSINSPIVFVTFNLLAYFALYIIKE